MVNKSWVYALAALICFSAAFGLLLHTGLPQRQDFASIFILGTPVAPEVGALAPRFQAIHLDGTRWELNETQDTPIILNFWATWCPPCIKEMPDLDRLQSYFEPNFLKIVPISVDQQKSLAIVFYAEQGFQNLKLYYDADKMAMSEKLITGLPVTYLVDRNFKIHARLEGITKWDHPDVIKDLKEIMGAK